ncbi:hypothetical protein LMG24076_03069 [Trinickia soli]|mgnify:CR=1 FL=1|nr:hypothetical protein LMG24076_03069 [Trinickia soli]
MRSPCERCKRLPPGEISYKAATVMTSTFIRQLIIHTICNVTGNEPTEIAALHRVELNTRDWEQVFSRLEAALDIHTRMLTSTERSICIDTLTQTLHAKVAGNIIS